MSWLRCSLNWINIQFVQSDSLLVANKTQMNVFVCLFLFCVIVFFYLFLLLSFFFIQLDNKTPSLKKSSFISTHIWMNKNLNRKKTQFVKILLIKIISVEWDYYLSDQFIVLEHKIIINGKYTMAKQEVRTVRSSISFMCCIIKL